MKSGLSLIILLWALVLNPFDGAAQGTFSWSPPDTVSFALTPVKRHTVVRGWAFGLTAVPLKDSFDVFIKGLNVEVGPMGLVAGTFGTGYWLFGSFYGKADDEIDPDYFVKHKTYVKGISLSLFGMGESYNSGLILNGLAGWVHKIKGVQISGLGNISYALQGVSVATLYNDATVVHGVQIGLTNRCNSGNVVQIGLFNRIGRRVIPFINLNFSRKKRSTSDSLKR